MSFETIKNLLDSDLINETTRNELNEAWEAKLTEAREQVRMELREEFAQKYEHDKQVMVEALDRMVTEGLSSEIQQVAAEKQALAEDRVKFQSKMKESSVKFDRFMVDKLSEEISELRKDRKQYGEGFNKLENFVITALAEEIADFHQDKKDLVETKVRLVAEARNKLEDLKATFVAKSAKKLSESVSKHLKGELTQLKEDIKVAREYNFGRRIFEAYAAEFGTTYLNENQEIRNLHSAIASKDKKLAEAIKLTKTAKVLVESKDREIRMIKENNVRTSTLEDLLAPLNQEKQAIMRNLLESVQTSRLKNAFEKYLPAVLANNATAKNRTVIAESVAEVTGDKNTVKTNDDRSNVIEIKRLAGL